MRQATRHSGSSDAAKMHQLSPEVTRLLGQPTGFRELSMKKIDPM